MLERDTYIGRQARKGAKRGARVLWTLAAVHRGICAALRAYANFADLLTTNPWALHKAAPAVTADRTVARLCRHDPGFRLEHEDVRQDLLLDPLSRLGTYNPRLGSPETFVAVCFRHRSARIPLTAHGERLSRHPFELGTTAVMGAPTPLIDTLSESEGFGSWVGQPTDRQIELDQLLDLDRMLAALSKDMAMLCAAFVDDQRCSGTVAGRSRITRHRRVWKLRDRLTINFAARPHPSRLESATLSATTTGPELGK